MSFNSVFIGMGNGWIAMIDSMVSTFVARMPMAYIFGFVMGWGVTGIACSIPLATLVGSTCAGIFYATGVWKKNAIQFEKQ